MGHEATGTISRVWAWEAELMLLTDITAPADTTHRHVAVQLLVSLGEPVRLWTEQTGWVESRGSLVATDVEHGIDSCGQVAFGGWVDPRSQVGRMLAQRHLTDTDLAVLGDDVTDRIAALAPEDPDELDADDALALWDDVLATVAPEALRTGTADPRVRRVLATVDGMAQLPPVEDLADDVGLSVSHLQHLIRRDTGLSLRRWVLWRRTIAALGLLNEGASITEAAHRGGFADGAHFTRSVTAFLAFPPSVIVGDPRIRFVVGSRLDLTAAA